MSGFENTGKLFVIAGALLVVTGLLLTFWQKLPLGRLPGDIIIRGEGFSFFFPVVTSLVISSVLTIILNLVFRLFR